MTLGQDIVIQERWQGKDRALYAQARWAMEVGDHEAAIFWQQQAYAASRATRWLLGIEQ